MDSLIFLVLVLILILSGMVRGLIKSDKSKRYRRTYTDLYIVAMIRKFADKENINLDEEYKKYDMFEARNKDVDEVIENNINAKINAETEKIKKDNGLK